MVPAASGRLVVKVDMLVEGTDVPPGMGYREAARKAVAACVSDFAAKGVRPDSFLVSLGLKRGTTRGQVRQLGEGFRDAEREWGAGLVGGDTNEARELVIDCAMLGFAEEVVERRGARPGDILVVTGSFGLQSSGLRILTKGARAEPAFRAKATRSVLKPTPDLEVGVALSKYLTSGMDSSDGLARCIHTLARSSGVGFAVKKLPEAEGVREFAGANGLCEEDLVFQGGEEYVIVGTVRKARLRAAAAAAKKAGGRLLAIGEATARRGRVELLTGAGSRAVADEGWTHLR
jgi:thiamine-monophosphate kinase